MISNVSEHFISQENLFSNDLQVTINICFENQDPKILIMIKLRGMCTKIVNIEKEFVESCVYH